MEREMYIVRNTRTVSETTLGVPDHVGFDDNVALNARLSLFGSHNASFLYKAWWYAAQRFARTAELLDQMAGGVGLVPNPYPPEWKQEEFNLDQHRASAVRHSDDFEELVRAEMLPSDEPDVVVTEIDDPTDPGSSDQARSRSAGP
jgi:hypothetical protein